MNIVEKIKKILVTKQSFENKINIYVLGIPFIRIVDTKQKYKYYLLGIHLFNIHKKINEQKIYQKSSYSEQFSENLLCFYDSLQRYLSKKHNDKTAILGVLPPEDTGIAIYNQSIFANRKEFDCFTHSHSLSKLFYVYNSIDHDNFNIYTTDVYAELGLSKKYKTKIYVLGNSFHNVPYLKLAIDEVDKKNTWLYIHEANLLSLFFNCVDNDISKLHIWLKRCYPEKYHLLKNFKTWSSLASHAKIYGIYGVKLIMEVTGISNFILNNDVCENILYKEIRRDLLSVKKIVLPFPNLHKVKAYKGLSSGVKYIGSFGIPGGAKLTSIVADAVYLLNTKYSTPVKLILAGYNLQNYCTYDLTESQKKYMIYFNSPDDEELFSLMKRVDIAVQLREHPHGESSGPISQLFGMNKKVITNEGFIDSEFENYCYVLPVPVTAESLALKIMEALKDKEPNYDILINCYSFDNLANELYKI